MSWALADNPIPRASAAPHLPAGILSPYSNGERGAVIDDFASHQRCKKAAGMADSSLLPVTIRGEGAGRRMRGGTSGWHFPPHLGRLPSLRWHFIEKPGDALEPPVLDDTDVGAFDDGVRPFRSEIPREADRVGKAIRLAFEREPEAGKALLHAIDEQVQAHVDYFTRSLTGKQTEAALSVLLFYAGVSFKPLRSGTKLSE